MNFRSALLIIAVLVAPASVCAKVNGDKPVQKVEQSLAAEPSVTVSVCLMSGSVKVQGWDRNEVVARSTSGAKLELRRTDARQSGSASRMEVFVIDNPDSSTAATRCQSFSDVDVSVPRGASVHLQTGDGDIYAVGVAAVYARSQFGDVKIEKAARSIEVGSFNGDISVCNSTGRISLKSISGAMKVVDVSPAEAEDPFEVSTTSGDVDLDQVKHKQVQIRTVNGNVHMVGPLAAQGRYNFNSTSGDLILTMPADSSFQLFAKVAQSGEIITDFPLTIRPEGSGSAATVVSSTRASAVGSTSSSSSSSVTPEPDVASSVEQTSPTNQTPAPSAKTKPSKAATLAAPLAPAKPPERPDAGKNPNPNPKISIKIDPVILFVPYQLRRINGVHGSGDSIISVASFSGTVHLQQQ